MSPQRAGRVFRVGASPVFKDNRAVVIVPLLLAMHMYCFTYRQVDCWSILHTLTTNPLFPTCLISGYLAVSMASLFPRDESTSRTGVIVTLGVGVLLATHLALNEWAPRPGEGSTRTHVRRLVFSFQVGQGYLLLTMYASQALRSSWGALRLFMFFIGSSDLVHTMWLHYYYYHSPPLQALAHTSGMRRGPPTVTAYLTACYFVFLAVVMNSQVRNKLTQITPSLEWDGLMPTLSNKKQRAPTAKQQKDAASPAPDGTRPQDAASAHCSQLNEAVKDLRAARERDQARLHKLERELALVLEEPTNGLAHTSKYGTINRRSPLTPASQRRSATSGDHPMSRALQEQPDLHLRGLETMQCATPTLIRPRREMSARAAASPAEEEEEDYSASTPRLLRSPQRAPAKAPERVRAPTEERIESQTPRRNRREVSWAALPRNETPPPGRLCGPSSMHERDEQCYEAVLMCPVRHPMPERVDGRPPSPMSSLASSSCDEDDDELPRSACPRALRAPKATRRAIAAAGCEESNEPALVPDREPSFLRFPQHDACRDGICPAASRPPNAFRPPAPAKLRRSSIVPFH